MTEQPYALDPAAAGTLTEQLADNLRRAIANGLYKAGDRLPGIRRMAELCGTSVQVPIAAMRMLADEGLVKARPRIGSVVLERSRKVWRGRVLLVRVGSHTNYSQNIFANEVSVLIEAGNWQVEHVFVPRSGELGDYNLEAFEKKLADKFDLALLPASDPPVIELVRKSGTPCMLIWGQPGEMKSGGDCAMLYSGARRAIDEFASHCHECGIKHIIRMFLDSGPPPDFGRQLGKGVKVEDIPVHVEFSLLCLENFSRCAYDALLARLANRRARRPDLIYFHDDYLARGGIWALEKAGLRVPEDMKVVTLTNYGNAPFFPLAFTRLECNPYKSAVHVAQTALKFLLTGHFSGSVFEEINYVRGETF